MRWCRFRRQGIVELGLFGDDFVAPLADALAAHRAATGRSLSLTPSAELLDLLPPNGAYLDEARELADWLSESPKPNCEVAVSEVELLVPIPRPPKLLLLAGNYAEHVEELGGAASERRETFPYVFMKPPSTTLTDPGRPVVLPKLSPDFIDWEIELGVIIGRRAKHVAEADALGIVAGYTVVNDISNRKFRPNPERRKREKDGFFDWLHGKWFDGFCPCGPAVLAAAPQLDPQSFDMTLQVDGETMQQGSTAQMVFPVAALVAFVSSFVTLEPGDILSTGTPAGVGHGRGRYLRAGETVTARIDRIGTLTTPIVAE